MRMMVAVLLMVALGGCSDSNSGGQDMSAKVLGIGAPCPPDSPTSSACGPFPMWFCADHPGGYCKTSCRKDADCPQSPTASVCAGGSATKLGECHKICNQASAASDCRLGEGYICKKNPDDASHDYCDVNDDAGPDGGA